MLGPRPGKVPRLWASGAGTFRRLDPFGDEVMAPSNLDDYLWPSLRSTVTPAGLAVGSDSATAQQGDDGNGQDGPNKHCINTNLVGTLVHMRYRGPEQRLLNSRYQLRR
jgi:hypothetical protein